jgi:hypothetical protein
MLVLKRVLAVKERFDVVDCSVETNLGYRTITIRNFRENVEQPAPYCYPITMEMAIALMWQTWKNWTK